MVHRCLEKIPEQRFQSAHDVAFALEAVSDSGALNVTTVVDGREKFNRKSLTFAGLVIIALMALTGGLYFYLHPKPKLTEKDTIVLSDFANSTGDPIFDDTLKQGLTTALRQSPFLNVLSDYKITATLQLMTRPPNTRLTPEVVREVCQRAGGKAWIGGSIAAIGSQYIVELKAVNCQNGDILAQERDNAESKEAVLDALGQAATKLRRELGESLASVQKFDVPLSQATTASLEALKAHSLGKKALEEQGPYAAIPFFQHAIELDPDFAEAYLYLGKMNIIFGEDSRAEQFFAKAYSLRQHTSEWERFDIESMYELFVTGDLQKCSRVFSEWLNSYPRDPVALVNFALVYSNMGQHQRAAELNRESIKRSPDDVIGYLDLASVLISLNQFQESHKTIQEAFDRKLDDEWSHYYLYRLAFLAGDAQGMAEQAAWYERKAEGTYPFFVLRSSVETYFGHIQKARQWSRRAVEAARSTGNDGSAASERMRETLSEVALGNQREARQSALSVLTEPAVYRAATARGALILAWLGDAGADAILDKLNKRSPQDTLVQSVVLPTVRARIELARKNPERSIELLQASIPYEFTDVSFDGCLYSAYVRGEAQLAARRGTAAAVEFQKILDHRGLVSACETAVLARLGLARAYVLEGDMTKAKLAYQDFLTLWKDADPDIPVLEEAKAEYASLN